RWYTADVPNSSNDDAKNTALEAFAAAPSATATSTMPSTTATGNVPAWIQPRHVGLTSSGCSIASASSGRVGRSSCSGGWSAGEVIGFSVGRTQLPRLDVAYELP